MALDVLKLDGTLMLSGQMNNLFPDAQIGSGTTVAWFMIHNSSTGNMTGVRVFLTVDPAGVTTRMAVADGTPRVTGWYGPPTPGSWSIPTESTALVAVTADAPLPPGQRVLVAVQRDTSSGSAVWPETNHIIATATGPA